MTTNFSVLAVLLSAAVSVSACSPEISGTSTANIEDTQGGLVPETAPVRAVILSMSGAEDFILPVHEAILRALPPTVETWLLDEEDDPSGTLEAYSADVRGRIHRIHVENDSPWTRDFIPESVVDDQGAKRLVHFQYHDVLPMANHVAQSLSGALGLPLHESPLHLEGGNLLTDGRGTLFTTTRVLEKNPTLAQEQVESELKQSLGVQRVEWFPPMPKERTGHIDLFAKFISPSIVLVADSRDSEQKAFLTSVASRFTELGYDVQRVTNAPLHGRNTMSYVNSLIVGDVAVVPQYENVDSDSEGDRNAGARASDQRAKSVYEQLGFRVEQAPSYAMALQGGSVHCLSHQIPAGFGSP